MGTFSHNKKRNSGLVYEFLVRQLSRSMIESDKEVYQRTLGIIRRYYAPGTPIAEERELFDVVKNTRGATESAARKILGEIQRAAAAIDPKKLDIKKSNVIKEINHSFGRMFWYEHRIPDYKLLATIQMIIDAARSGKSGLTESVQNIQLEEGIVKYMTSQSEYSQPQHRNEEIDQLVMAVTAKKFQEKYASSLNTMQKKLLHEFMQFQITGDADEFSKLIVSERKNIIDTLSRAESMKEFSEDQHMKNKLIEARNGLTNSDSTQHDKIVEDLMLYYQLIEEIESND